MLLFCLFLSSNTVSLRIVQVNNYNLPGEEESDGAGAASAADATTGASASTSSDFQGSNAADSVERVRARLRELDNELEDLEHTIAQLSARQSDLRAERARLGARSVCCHCIPISHS